MERRGKKFRAYAIVNNNGRRRFVVKNRPSRIQRALIKGMHGCGNAERPFHLSTIVAGMYPNDRRTFLGTVRGMSERALNVPMGQVFEIMFDHGSDEELIKMGRNPVLVRLLRPHSLIDQCVILRGEECIKAVPLDESVLMVETDTRTHVVDSRHGEVLVRAFDAPKKEIVWADLAAFINGTFVVESDYVRLVCDGDDDFHVLRVAASEVPEKNDGSYYTKKEFEQMIRKTLKN